MSDMELNPNNLSGSQFRVFKNRMSAMALQTPGKYHILKGYVTEKLEQELIDDIYKIVRNFMSKGKLKDGTDIVVPLTYEGNTGSVIKLGPVNYPHNKVNNAALSLVNVVMGEIESIIECVLPSDYSKLANSRLALGGAGKTVNI